MRREKVDGSSGCFCSTTWHVELFILIWPLNPVLWKQHILHEFQMLFLPVLTLLKVSSAFQQYMIISIQFSCNLCCCFSVNTWNSVAGMKGSSSTLREERAAPLSSLNRLCTHSRSLLLMKLVGAVSADQFPPLEMQSWRTEKLKTCFCFYSLKWISRKLVDLVLHSRNLRSCLVVITSVLGICYL